MTLDEMLDALVGREGGYVNNPNDRGGPTKFGITEQVARAYGFVGDMRGMTRDMAKSIYRSRYWKAPRYDEVFLTFPRVAEELFDTGVNMGPKVASAFLQRALNVLNRNATDYPDIAADGVIGAMTIHALESYYKRRGKAGESVLLKALNALQGARYIAIAEADPKQESFVTGWLANRVGDLAA